MESKTRRIPKLVYVFTYYSGRMFDWNNAQTVYSDIVKVNGGVAKTNKEGGTTISDGKDQRPKFDLDMDDVEKIRKQLGL